VTSFEDMGLRLDLLKGVYGHGFEVPSVIQQKAIIPLAKGLDIITQSQSGTGKTGSFAIGLLQRINPSLRAVQALVLGPTRELAQQTADTVESIGSYMQVKVHAALSGNPVKRDDMAIRRGAQVIVGTPGRVDDLLRRNILSLKDLAIIILDEADQMLDQGFSDVIPGMLSAVPKGIQIGMFSATLPNWALEFAARWLSNPLRITIPLEDNNLEGIRQYYIDVDKEEYKLQTLVDLYEFLNVSQSVVFVNTKSKANYLVDALTALHFTVSAIHSDLSAEEREDVMKTFRAGRSRVLIATDIVARGIDVQGVSVVINFDLTDKFGTYVHRIGRCGRFGRKGLAINFVTGKEHRLLRELEAYYSIQIPELPSNFNQTV